MQPNVLYIMVDCLRADVCYGLKGKSRTPVIDALRKKGAAFTRMMSVTSTTTPNIASVFTGVYPFRHGVRALKGYKIAPDLKTLAGLLKSNGYNAHGLVTGPITRDTGLDRGFDTFEPHSGKETLFNSWLETLKTTIKGFKPPWFVYLHLWELHTVRRLLSECDNSRYGSNLYERSVSSIDRKLGELLGSLPENTLVVLSGDHGENYDVPLWHFIRNKLSKLPGLSGIRSRRHPKYHHGYGLYDFLINIPFVLYGPGIPEGMVTDRLSSQVDMMPTILDIVKADTGDANDDMHGRSLLPALSDVPMETRPVYLEACGRNIPSPADWLKGVRTEDWKLVYAPKNEGIEPLLFDLKNDPDEWVNLYRERPEVAEELKGLILGMETDIETKGMALVGEEMSEDEKARTEEQLRNLGYIE